MRSDMESGWLVSASSPEALSDFLDSFTAVYRSVPSETFVNLSVDDDIPEGPSEVAYAALKEIALKEFADPRSWLRRRLFPRNSFSAISIDLADDAQRQAFCTIVPHLINSEIWVGEKMILSSVGDMNEIWVRSTLGEMDRIRKDKPLITARRMASE
ncbi:hypothetical protein ACWC5I_19460 [Kitasatospora sp. NPDC001574]